MVREGIPFVIIPFAAVIVFAMLHLWIPAAAFLLLTAFMAYFFRDPRRSIPEGSGLVVSAADGRVTRIDKSGSEIVISVFMSPFDVHINRSPIAGTITSIDYIRGKKMPATNDNASFVNERNTLRIEGEGVSVACTQIAGIVARRIVCWPGAGEHLERGQKFGLIKFSSRADVVLPAHAEICVAVGDKVKGGETIIAKLDGR